jgi:hypothetical protein
VSQYGALWLRITLKTYSPAGQAGRGRACFWTGFPAKKHLHRPDKLAGAVENPILMQKSLKICFWLSSGLIKRTEIRRAGTPTVHFLIVVEQLPPPSGGVEWRSGKATPDGPPSALPIPQLPVKIPVDEIVHPFWINEDVPELNL